MRRTAPLLIAVIVLIGLGSLWLQRIGAERRAEEAGWPQVDGVIAAPGPAAPLRVLRDARGVPHVEAESESDAYFGLGFVHAQDRLGQMVSLWLAARGRTAEFVGVEGLPGDRLARVLGIGAQADRQAGRLDAPIHRLLRAYAAGVNARLARVRAGLAAPPAPFTLETLPLERWQPADSVAVLKLWAWGLGGSLETSLVLDDLLRTLGPEEARAFFPKGAGISSVPGERPSMVEALPPGRPRPPSLAFRDPLRRRLGLQAAGVGSSAWVLAGSASASGRPLLAGDAHLEVTVPAHLHQAHLRGGELDVAGAAIPGVPVFWSGANAGVAWAATAARASVIDLFVESLESGPPRSPGGPGRYHDGKRWRPLSVRSEELGVRGGEPVALEIRETGHGPLVNDLLETEREPLALAWSGAVSGDGIGPFLRAARAADGSAFTRALARHHEPALAVVWADAAGEGGLQVAGWIPRRALPSGLVPVSGRSAWAEWSDRVPAERLPAQRLGRDRRFVIAADGPLEAGPGRRIEWLWRTGERSKRIAVLLDEAATEGGASLRRMIDLQADVFSPGADAVLGPALKLAGSPAQLAAEEREIQALLQAWDRNAEPGSIGAGVYHVFLNELSRELLGPVLGPELYERWAGLVHTSPTPMLAEILTAVSAGGAASPAWARNRVIATVRSALRTTWLHFGVEVGPNRDKWSWGRLHFLTFRPLGGLWPARSLEPALGPHPYPGGPLTISAGGYAWGEPFAVRSASTHRLAVDAAELDTLLVSMAPGQVEQVGHPHRSDEVEPWLAGRPQLLLRSPVLLEEQAVARLEIVPEGGL
ncbi:MAG: penicillin acylase family protein [Deltaproteobacteria bacterium]|nr:penicillin acylase family protein [Deltaproteobacteria bacterium]MBW2446024.1 penicillin acylase family protein [Deltaproteobacteria bacterium]